MQIYDETCTCGATGLILRSERTSACWWGGRAGRPHEPPLVEERCVAAYPRTCPVCGDRPAERDRART